jgi:hypothetical protein
MQTKFNIGNLAYYKPEPSFDSQEVVIDLGDLASIQTGRGIYSPVPIADVLDRIVEAEITDKYTAAIVYRIELDRLRRLLICPTNGEQFITIEEYDENDVRISVDLVCLFNGHYDGELYAHTLQNVYEAIARKQLTLK